MHGGRFSATAPNILQALSAEDDHIAAARGCILARMEARGSESPPPQKFVRGSGRRWSEGCADLFQDFDELPAERQAEAAPMSAARNAAAGPCTDDQVQPSTLVDSFLPSHRVKHLNRGTEGESQLLLSDSTRSVGVSPCRQVSPLSSSESLPVYPV